MMALAKQGRHPACEGSQPDWRGGLSMGTPSVPAAAAGDEPEHRYWAFISYSRL